MWSDVLRNRYPYRDISFEQRAEQDSIKAYPGFQHHGLQRNISSLLDSNFSLEEKSKALKILYKTIISDEIRNEAIQYGITKGITHLLCVPESDIIEYCCKLINQLCKVRQGIEFCDHDKVDVQLLHLLSSDSTTTSTLFQCSHALQSISTSCDILIPKYKQAIPIIATLLSKEMVFEEDYCIHLMQILFNITRRNIEGRQQCIENNIIQILTLVMNQIAKSMDSKHMELLKYSNLVLNSIVIEKSAKELVTDLTLVTLFECIDYFLEFKNEQHVDIAINSMALIIVLEDAKIRFCKLELQKSKRNCIEELTNLKNKTELDSVKRLLQQCKQYIASLQ